MLALIVSHTVWRAQVAPIAANDWRPCYFLICSVLLRSSSLECLSTVCISYCRPGAVLTRVGTALELLEVPRPLTLERTVVVVEAVVEVEQTKAKQSDVKRKVNLPRALNKLCKRSHTVLTLH